tara:strand:- start:17236 stop:18480 length:1245 start_codon:yes stop_codon:yes gene_type:complete
VWLSEKFSTFQYNLNQNNFFTVKKNFLSPLTLVIAVLLLACNSGQTVDKTNEIATIFKTKYAPDKRVAVFNVKAEQKNGAITLTGETDKVEGMELFVDSLKKAGIAFENEIETLPSAELGDKIYAVANNSVVNMRSNARHSAELATQALLGMPLNVLKKSGGWYLVQSPDEYISWIDQGGIKLMNKEELDSWKKADKIIYLSNYGFSYESAKSTSPKIGDLVMGNVLQLVDTQRNFYEVKYPDGRIGFVLRSEAQPFERWRTSLKATQESLVATGKELMGVPYLWGGTSTKGVDCSGFTKTIYLMNGDIIPRDASQQITAGENVDLTKNFENLEPGDLLFFGVPATADKPQRVVHVGMWIGNNEYIHSSSRVQINSVDPNAENFSEYNLNRYLESRRYLTSRTDNMLEVSQMFD